MTDKITVELDIEDARELARGTWLSASMRHVQSAVKAALPPEWEEGTLARITTQYDGTYLAEFRDGKWVVGRRGGDGDVVQSFKPHAVVKVEPIRVLKDDEVVIPRASISVFRSATEFRSYAERLEDENRLAGGSVFRALADALEAEK